MKFPGKIFAMASMFLFVLFAGPAAESKAKIAHEQTSFCGDDAPDDLKMKSDPLPPMVIAAVMNTREGKEARGDARSHGEELVPEEILKGTKVHIANTHALFYLVIGSSYMSGADNTWFWIVRQAHKNAQVLLFTGGNCLDISGKKSFHYRNIVMTWSSSNDTLTEIYHYNGRLYKRWKSKSVPNRPFPN